MVTFKFMFTIEFVPSSTIVYYAPLSVPSTPP
jgi:hypothetical protein